MTTERVRVGPGPLVVGYDGREESEIALDRGLAEARLRGTDVVVLVVAQLYVDTVDPLDPGMVGLGSAMPELTADGPVTIAPIVREAKSKLAASGVGGAVEWTFGKPASEILRVADERNASAIVVGTHHHSALSRFLGGDVAGSIVRHAHREIVIAR